MLLSERCLKDFIDMQERLASVGKCSEPEIRVSYREEADMLQRNCGDIAHCIALFGDVSTHELSREHALTTEQIHCSGMHPWRNGLRLVRPDLAFASSQGLPLHRLSRTHRPPKSNL
jgi:hypothetical protein